MNPRPTPEQMARYEANFAATGKSEPFKDIYIVGDFLSDLMEEAGFGDQEIHDTCFTLGRLCFGREPWAAFDLMWAGAQRNAEARKRQATYADTPVDQDVPEPTPLFTEYLGQVRHFCGAEGVFPQPLLHRDTEGKVAFVAVAADGMVCLRQAKEALKTGTVEELVFGMDRSARPGQGLEFNDFITVVWYVGGEFYTAVINYKPAEDEDDRIFRLPDWNNNWWNNELRAALVPELQAVLEASP